MSHLAGQVTAFIQSLIKKQKVTSVSMHSFYQKCVLLDTLLKVFIGGGCVGQLVRTGV